MKFLDLIEDEFIETGKEIIFYGLLNRFENVYKAEHGDFAIYRVKYPFIIKDDEVKMFNDNEIKVQGYCFNNLYHTGIYRFRAVVEENKKFKYSIKIKSVYPYMPKRINKYTLTSYIREYYKLTYENTMFILRILDKKVLSRNTIVIDDNFIKSLYDDVKGLKDEQVYNEVIKNQIERFVDMRKSFEKLKSLGLSEKKIIQMGNSFKREELYNLLIKNPYRILVDEENGYNFFKCDKFILKKLNGRYDDKNRIEAACIKTLYEYQHMGHCYILKDVLMMRAKEIINVKMTIAEMIKFYNENNSVDFAEYVIFNNKFNIDINLLKQEIDNYNDEEFYEDKVTHLYSLYEIDEEVLSDYIEKFLNGDSSLIRDKEKIYLKDIYNAEIYLSEKIKELTNYKKTKEIKEVEEILDEICKEKDVELESMQRQACIEFALYDKGLFILTGGPGTGKTFVLEVMLELEKRLKPIELNPFLRGFFNAERDKPLLLAPTGKASKVLEESVGKEAYTIHRKLLSLSEEQKLGNRLIYVDEFSMVDIVLAKKLFSKIDNDSKVVLIGDTDQIPSIGPGNVLKDILSSNKVINVRLNIVKRQGKKGTGKGIVENIDNILKEKMIESKPKEGDFYIIEKENSNEVVDMTLRSIDRILKKFPRQTINDIQILTPRRTGKLGADYFNYFIQEKYNKNKLKVKVPYKTVEIDFEEKEIYFKVGDIVMQNKNSYNRVLYDTPDKKFLSKKDTGENIGVFNGEVGIIEDIRLIKNKEVIIVNFNGQYAYYQDGFWSELDLAYAITIHKCQGSSLNSTITIVSKEHEFMWFKNLLYTALSRARNFSVVIGDKETIEKSILTNIKMERFTYLKNRICN